MKMHRSLLTTALALALATPLAAGSPLAIRTLEVVSADGAELSAVGATALRQGTLAPAAAPIVWDFGPTSGAPSEGCWVNDALGQNLTERATFAVDTFVTTVYVYSCLDQGGPTVRLKILADNGSGSPGAYLYVEDKAPDAWVIDPGGSGFRRVTFHLATPFLAQAGQTYWYGVSGIGFQFGQKGVYEPDNSRMGQFLADTFQGHTGTNVGDMMFQLAGFVACEALRDLAATIRDPAITDQFAPFPSYQVIMGYLADAAARNCDVEDWRDVVTLLGRIIERTDDVTPPSDWMIPGAAKTGIHDTAVSLRAAYATLLP